MELILPQIKRIYEEYEFVRGKSGVGWDDAEKKATAEPEYIERFVAVRVAKSRSTMSTDAPQEHGGKYEKCFKRSCPYYNRLTKLFGGNRATGEHVLHLKKTKPTNDSSKSSASSSKREATREPLEPLNNEFANVNLPDSADASPPASPKPYDDELLSPPRKRARISEVTPDKDDEHRTENDPPKTKISAQDHGRSISVGSSSGGRRASRNAEAGHQIAHGLKLIGESMSAPIITKADTSHIDAIVDTFAADPSLLPDDPDGSYYALLLDALSANEMRARVFTKTSNRVQRIAFLKRVLLEMEMDVPVDWV